MWNKEKTDDTYRRSAGQLYGLNVCVPPPSSYVEALIPSVMVFGGEAFGGN